MKADLLTIRIVEEYQIVDGGSELKPQSTLLPTHREALGNHVRAEMIRSALGAGTGVCETVGTGS
jgi:hypothetical protein